MIQNGKRLGAVLTKNTREGGEMSNEKIHIREQLNRLSDELIDNIINTPDVEILKEVEEDYGDPSFVANRVREMLKKSRIRAGKNRLQSAMEGLKRSENKHQKRDGDTSNSKEELSKFLRESLDFEDKLTLAARNGKEISEEDAKGILKDLEELKNRSTWKKDDKK